MLPGPDIVRACPNCSAPFIESTIRSGNTFGAKIWSDGKMEAPMLPERFNFVSCPECNMAFWLDKANELDRVNWDERNDKYPAAKFYSKPTIGQYIEGLRNEELSKEDETYLRVKLLHCFNDHFRGGIPESQLSKEDLDNKIKLTVLLGEQGDDLLFKAEIFRELGEFDKALTILGHEFDQSIKKISEVLRRLCLDKNSNVVLLDEYED